MQTVGGEINVNRCSKRTDHVYQLDNEEEWSIFANMAQDH